MKTPRNIKFPLAALLLVCALAISGFGQNVIVPVNDDQIIGTDFASTVHPQSTKIQPHAHQNGQAHARFGVPNVDSLVNFNGHFFVDGFDSSGNPNRDWYWNVIGNPPQLGGTTALNAPIVPVSLDLLKADGSFRFHYDAGQFVQPVLDSPVFQNFSYSSSSVPTQFTDAVQRAEFFNKAKSDWHTLLNPSVKTGRTIRVPFSQYVLLRSRASGALFVLMNADFFVNALFPTVATDTTTPIGAAENAGEITTKDLSTFLFPNTFLYVGNDPFAPGACCILGFHTYDFEPGDDSNGNVEKRYVVNYSSWISPGIFGSGFADITALSHEIAEAYNDPFVTSDNVHDVTPWWLAPNGNCQNDLETGDVVEGLPNATFPITMNGLTYHPQNEALIQWFQSGTSSDALDGAFSYPNEGVLPAANISQNFQCK